MPHRVLLIGAELSVLRDHGNDEGEVFPSWIADRFAETEGLTDYGFAESRFSASSTSACAEALAATFSCWISR